ncbi:hypothetical protein MMAN_15970 [Mycobacterium mantenii]|uniref:Uncharacterized protein n=1 Tax=Mycobacterium mantenii TaxID=560555 RepID=A0ABN6A6G7_MYCNT|nr:hypothetical protein MMAN_15970 [Mycobacterium mantenii]
MDHIEQDGTDMRPKNLGREDVDHLRRRVVRSPERNGRIFAIHKTFAWIAHDEVADIPEPKLHGHRHRAHAGGRLPGIRRGTRAAHISSLRTYSASALPAPAAMPIRITVEPRPRIQTADRGAQPIARPLAAIMRQKPVDESPQGRPTEINPSTDPGRDRQHHRETSSAATSKRSGGRIDLAGNARRMPLAGPCHSW